MLSTGRESVMMHSITKSLRWSPASRRFSFGINHIKEGLRWLEQQRSFIDVVVVRRIRYEKGWPSRTGEQIAHRRDWRYLRGIRKHTRRAFNTEPAKGPAVRLIRDNTCGSLATVKSTCRARPGGEPSRQ